MTRSDLERVGEILFTAFSTGAQRHGYPSRIHSVQEGQSWAWAMLRHGPSEILIAEVEGRAIGICCLNPRGVHGGIGPVAVDPLFQGYGIGRQLMDALLTRAADLLSVRLFQEAFNPASFSLYYSLEFIPVAELLDLMVHTADRKTVDPCSKVHDMASRELDEVSTYDMPRSKLDRRSDLAYYRQWGKIYVYRHQSQIRGYLACLPGSQSVQLGPLVTEGEEEAACLLHNALGAFHGRTCQTRVMARDHELVRTLMGLGFRLYCLDLLMVRGSWRPGHYAEAYGRFPEGT